MTTQKTIISFVIIFLVAGIAYVLSHSFTPVVFVLIGGFLGLRFGKRIRPEVEALKADPDALRKPRK